MSEQVKISSAASGEEQFSFSDTPSWQECLDKEREKLLKIIKEREEEDRIKRLMRSIAGDELQKARKEGEMSKATEIASNFIKMGVLTFEQIASGTGLPVEEVAALHQRLSATL